MTEILLDGSGKVGLQCSPDIEEKAHGVGKLTELMEKKMVINSEKIEADGHGGENLGGKKRRMRNPNYLDKYLKSAEQRRGPVIEHGVKGKVKWYNLWSRYGFLTRDDVDDDTEKPRDVFVHQSAIANSRLALPYLRSLRLNEPVEFDIVEGRNGPEADNVSGLDGHPVKGIPYFLFNIYANRRGMRRTGNEEKHDEDVKGTEEVTNEKKGQKMEHRRRRNGTGSRQKDIEEDATKENQDKKVMPRRRRRTSQKKELKDGDDEIKKQSGKPRSGRRHLKRHEKGAEKPVQKGHDENENACAAEARGNKRPDSETPEPEKVVGPQPDTESADSDGADVAKSDPKISELLEEVLGSIESVTLVENDVNISIVEKVVAESHF